MLRKMIHVRKYFVKEIMGNCPLMQVLQPFYTDMNSVEDELHFSIICRTYKHLRDKLDGIMHKWAKPH